MVISYVYIIERVIINTFFYLTLSSTLLMWYETGNKYVERVSYDIFINASPENQVNNDASFMKLRKTCSSPFVYVYTFMS